MKLALCEAIRTYVEKRGEGKLARAEKKFEGVSAETIYCIYAQDLQRRVRLSHHRHKKKVDEYLTRYTQGESLLDIADSIDFPPVLLVRQTIERVFGLTKQAITAALKNPDSLPAEAVALEVVSASGKGLRLTIDGSRLRSDVRKCVQADLVQAPEVDVARRALGLEYEARLYARLTELGIAFETEDDLREAGFSKTPDAKLLVPIGVCGRVVTWIDSKASFGDEYMHRQQAGEQFQGYVNRFGPGLVIYWFGFIDELQGHHSEPQNGCPTQTQTQTQTRLSDAQTPVSDGQPDVLLMDRFPSRDEVVLLPCLPVEPRP